MELAGKLETPMGKQPGKVIRHFKATKTAWQSLWGKCSTNSKQCAWWAIEVQLGLNRGSD